MRKVIVNSTPIISLCKIGRIDILKAMYSEIIIPEAVYTEVTKKDDVVKTTLESNKSWISVKTISNEIDKRMYKARLHDGEVEVMILAQEENADLVVIDDLPARKTAQYLGLTLTGTLGILIKAKENGIIDAVMPLIHEMQLKHIYFSENLINMVRAICNE